MLKHQTITCLEKQLCSSFSFAYFLIKAFPDMLLPNTEKQKL